MSTQKPAYGSKPVTSTRRNGLFLDLPMLGVGDLEDYSGNTKDGTNNNGTWGSGERGNVLDLGGIAADASVTIPPMSLTNFTLIINHFPRSYSLFFLMLMGEIDNVNNFYSRRDSGVFRIRFDDATDIDSVATGDAGLNAWFTAAVTYDGSNVIFYQDGNLIDTVASASKTFVLDNIGDPFAGRSFDGLINYVQAYNRVLTQAEIQGVIDDPWQDYRKNNLSIWAGAQALVTSVNLIDGLLERKRLIA